MRLKSAVDGVDDEGNFKHLVFVSNATSFCLTKINIGASEKSELIVKHKLKPGIGQRLMTSVKEL